MTNGLKMAAEANEGELRREKTRSRCELGRSWTVLAGQQRREVGGFNT